MYRANREQVGRFVKNQITAEEFPNTFEEKLEIYYQSYFDDKIAQAVLNSAKIYGDKETLFIQKETFDILMPEEETQVLSPDEFTEMKAFYAQNCFGLEWYLASPTFQWLAFFCHEPCFYIGGTTAFIDIFKKQFPEWNNPIRQSLWSQEEGKMLCVECGNNRFYFSKADGSIDESGWHCPNCVSKHHS